jgi:diguanylate cyclase (GGDEF)-like protein
LGLVFQLVATATDNASAAPWWFYALIASGAIFTLWLVTVDRTADRRGRSLAAVLIVATYALQAALLVHYGPLMAGQWLMCWTYLAAGFLFVRQTPKLSIGVAFTALSFALWGLVFPVYTLLNIYYPTVSAHIEDGVWNLPKFLAAASMILMLLERRIASVTHLATHDELTGLANRRLYARSSTETIARARRAGCRFVLIVIDLNGFKEINDTMGHQAGDELLQEVATRLGAVVRHTDTLARTGGDEFTAILDQIGDVTQVDHITAAITGSVLEPVTIQGKTCFVTASIGVAVYPTDGTTIADLTAVADQRMYRHKDEYRAQLLRDD